MSRMTSASFDLGRSRHRCAVSGVGFSPGDGVVVALFEDLDADGVLHRLDFSMAGWEKFRGGAEVVVEEGEAMSAWAVPARVFASWKSVASEAGQKKRALMDEGSLLELFESLEGATDESQLAFRFVLALVLIRRKLLVHAGAVAAHEGGSEAGGDALLLVRAKGDPAEVPAMEVVQPVLTAERVSAVTARIDELLKAGVE